MPLDLEGIRARWQDVRWTYGTTRHGAAYLQTHHGDLEVDEASDVADALLLASHAPADVQALIGEVERVRAALHKIQSEGELVDAHFDGQTLQFVTWAASTARAALDGRGEG